MRCPFSGRRPLLALLLVVVARRVVAQDEADPSEQGGSVPVSAPVNVGTRMLKMSPEQVRVPSRVEEEEEEERLFSFRVCLGLLRLLLEFLFTLWSFFSLSSA